jgi:hypothetical protein
MLYEWLTGLRSHQATLRSFSEGKKPVALDDPFPIGSFRQTARESILHEFGGRCPTMRELAAIADPNLLKLPGVGLTTVRMIRSVVRSMARSLDGVELWSDERLLSERDHLLQSLCDQQNEFQRQQDERRCKLNAISLELHLRGIAPIAAQIPRENKNMLGAR